MATTKKARVSLPEFPIDLKKYKQIAIDPFTQEALTPEQKVNIKANIELCRNAIVVFTACGSKSGYGGHTGGAFDTAAEVVLLDAFFRGAADKFVPIFFDEAGHRVATQYLLSALQGHISADSLQQYRKGHCKLPGHPELGMTDGVAFSSGRLGHMWPYINGVALANPGKRVVCLGSDGSQMEGNDAEAARLAVAKNLNVSLLIDDNDVTITGHPSEYLKGYDVAKTLAGHGLNVAVAQGEDIDDLYAKVRHSVTSDGPSAVVCKRVMCVGVKGVEGTHKGHDAVTPEAAIAYLEPRGVTNIKEYLASVEKTKDPQAGKYRGAGKIASNRGTFGETLVEILGTMTPEDRKAKVMVIDSDLGSSTSIMKVKDAHPEVFCHSGIMERGNFSAAAGFGMEAGKQGIFATFAAFLEMCASEITMARLNRSNVLCHFSHSGVDDMADNTCHFGLNGFFADNGLDDGYETRLYFPADAAQVRACLKAVFPQPGLRFIFTTRSKLPHILDGAGEPVYDRPGYTFQPGVDDVVREGKDGYIVTFGDALYRCIDAVEQLKEQGISVGVVNKSTLNLIDEGVMHKIGASPFVLVVESFNRKTGLGSRFGTWLLERGLTPKYGYIGTHQEGCGGLWEHAYHQGYDPSSVIAKVKSLLGKE